MVFLREGQAGASQLFGHTLAPQGLIHEGVGEVDSAVGRAGIGQLGFVARAGSGEFLGVGMVLNGHFGGN